MKAVAAILLFVIASNSILYCAWFQVSLLLVKAGVVSAIALLDADDADRLLKIPVRTLDKDESDEVWYKGNLYDVVKRESDSNHINYVYVLADEKEEVLLSGAAAYFKPEANTNCPDHCKVHGFKNNHNSQALQYTIHNPGVSIGNHTVSLIPYPSLLACILSCKAEVPVPPPKGSFV